MYMKRNLLLMMATLLLASSMFAQTKNVDRECVLFELLTGVDCGNCPAADEAIEQMVEEGLSIAPVCYQAPSYSVPQLTNDEVAARVAYYDALGYPTLFVDGSTSLPGGYSGMNYMYYLPHYQTQIAKSSPFSIGMNLESIGDNMYKVNCHVEQVGDCSGSDVRVFIVLTQSHIPYSWGGGEYVNWNVRDMIPTQEGTPFAGPTMDFSETFEINYPLEDCQLVAWVQDYTGNKEVYQSVMMEASATPVYEETLTFDVDTLWVSLENTATPLTIHNFTAEDVTINKISISDSQDWYYFLYEGEVFVLDQEVDIEIPSGSSIVLELNMNISNIHDKEMFYPVLRFENSLEDVSLITAFEWTTGVEMAKAQTTQAYPNPVKDQLVLQADSPIESVEIYNSTGALVLRKSTEAQQVNISMTNLVSGAYFVRVKTNKEVNAFRVIKE